MPKIDKEHTEQFYINVNNIVRELLRNDILYTNRSATNEAIALIKKSLGLEERQAKSYLKAARKEIQKITEVQKKEAINQALRDRHYLVLQAKKENDHKLTLAIMQDRDKLRGLYEDKIIHSGEVAVTFVEKLDE